MIASRVARSWSKDWQRSSPAATSRLTDHPIGSRHAAERLPSSLGPSRFCGTLARAVEGADQGAGRQFNLTLTLARPHGYPIKTAPSLPPTPIRTSVFARMNDTPLRTRLQ